MELSPRDRAVAEALTVVGDGAEPYVVAAVAGVPLAELGAARDTLTANGLLRGTWFAHDLIADAISAELPYARRERLHRHAADALRDEPALAAGHLLATGPRADPEVSELLQRAAAGATPRAAAAYLDRALHERAPGDDRSALLAQLANATFDAGLPEARRRLRDALHEVRGRGRADVLTRLAALNLADADDRRLPELFDRELERETDPATRAAVAAASLDALIIQPGRQAERARRVSTLDTTDPLLTRVLLAHRAWIGLERGTPTAAECAALALHALDGVLLLEEAQRRCAYVIAVRTLVLTDDLQAPAKIAELLAEADERGSVRMRVAAERYAAELALRLGRVADAETHARLALDLVPEDVNAFTGGALEALVVALAERGAFAEAHELLQRYPVEGTAPWEIGMRHARARLWLAEGEYERAYADAAEAGRLRHEQGRVNPSLAPWRVTASLALSRLGRRDEAAALARTDLGLAERFGAPRPIAAALLALAIATADPATHAQRALEIAPDGLEAVRARIELGERDGLRRALADADAAGATLLADRARRELFAAGARPRHAALEGPEALTPRQRQLCELRRRGQVQPRDRPGAVPEHQDGRDPPRGGLPQARRQHARRAPALGGDRMRPHDHRVGDQGDLVGRHAGPRGLLAHLLGAGALVDADGPELARVLLDDVGTDPADVVRHLLAHLGRAGGGLLEGLHGVPHVTASNRIEVHARHSAPRRAFAQSGGDPDLCSVVVVDHPHVERRARRPAERRRR